jgi:hypothetical protein
VDSVGKNKKAIAEYIKNQLQEDLAYEQMSIKELVDPFTGEPVKKQKINRFSGRLKHMRLADHHRAFSPASALIGQSKPPAERVVMIIEKLIYGCVQLNIILY